MDFFFDTYAFFEIFRGNENYKNYNLAGMVTSRLNLMELHYGVLNEQGEKIADPLVSKYGINCIDITEDIIIESNKFRKNNKRLKMSYVDCIGYTIAKSRGVKFLTGDRAFEGLENVEFVK